MNALVTRYPEIARCAMSEARPSRLLVSAVTSLIVGACIFLVGYASGKLGDTLFHGAYGLQALILLVYGTARTTGSVMTERLEKTWDLQRLTPLSAWDLAIGKLLGAPIFAYYIFVLLLPWAVGGFLASEKIGFQQFLRAYLLLGSVAFLFLSGGLLVSASSTVELGGARSGTAGAFMGLFALQSFAPLFAAIQGTPVPLVFHGLSMEMTTFQIFSGLSFGAWALAGAKWRIGEEWMEPSRWWRIPAFMAFLAWYQLGWEKYPAAGVAGLLALFCYFVGVLNAEAGDYWRKWLKAPRDLSWFDAAPAWIKAAAAYTAVTAILMLLFRRRGLDVAHPAFSWYPVLQACFLTRDLAFLQWCRFTKSRKPELMATLFIALAYALPVIVLSSFKVYDLYFLFAPVPGEGSPLLSVIPALVQAIGACWITARSAVGVISRGGQNDE